MDNILKFATIFNSYAQVLGLGESQISKGDVQKYLEYLKGKGINYKDIAGWRNAKYTVLSLLQNIIDGNEVVQDEIAWGRKDLVSNYKEDPKYLDKIIGARKSLG